jgi:drug/metabolite transporter (DMT)-like permease
VARAPLPRRGDLPGVVLTGLLCGTAYQRRFNCGMRTVASGPAAVLVDTVPIFAALCGFFFLRERLNLWGVSGIALSFIGTVLVAPGEAGAAGFAFEPGALSFIGGAITFASALPVQIKGR